MGNSGFTVGSPQVGYGALVDEQTHQQFPVVIHNHYHFHEAPGADVAAELEAMRSQLTALTLGTYSLAQSVNTLEDTVAIDFSELTAVVAEDVSVDSSAKTLIEGMAAKLEELSAQVAQEPAVQQAINDAVAAIRASSGSLSDAVVANTPAAPAPAPEEPPAEPVA